MNTLGYTQFPQVRCSSVRRPQLSAQFSWYHLGHLQHLSHSSSFLGSIIFSACPAEGFNARSFLIMQLYGLFAFSFPFALAGCRRFLLAFCSFFSAWSAMNCKIGNKNSLVKKLGYSPAKSNKFGYSGKADHVQTWSAIAEWRWSGQTESILFTKHALS